jgi:hypothetical protein
MCSNYVRRATVAAVLTVAALAVASPVSADPGGAEVDTTVNECEVVGDGTFCTDSHFVFTFTETPSGNIGLVQHVRSNTSFTSPDCNSQDQFASRNHLLIKAGTDGEFHFAVRIHAVVDCPDRMSDCVTTLHFHRFLDKIQFDRQETVCTDPR